MINSERLASLPSRQGGICGSRLRASIIPILLVALILRLTAIDHGFPYIYHPDEPTVVRSALGIRFDPNPHHFDWPHLYFYLNYFVYMVFAKLRDLLLLLNLKQTIARTVPIIYNDELIFYLITRIFSAILGALTIIPIYLWVKKLINKNSAVLSATLFAVTPLHVRNSHYTLIDIPMLFFLSWSLFFSTFSPILAGLFLGFSASTKYNGVLGALMIVGYYLLTKRKFTDYLKTGLFTIIGFFIGTPFALLDYKTFIRTDGPAGALWQFNNVGKVGTLQQIQQFLDTLAFKLPENLGYGAMLIFFVGLVAIARNIVLKKSVDKMVGLTAIVFLALAFYISGQAKNRSHYYMVTYPYFLLAAGWALAKLVDKLKRPMLNLALIVMVLLPSLIMSVQNIVDLKTKVSTKIYGGDVPKNVKMMP